MIAVSNVLQLYTYLKEKYSLSYLLSSKLSQDYTETILVQLDKEEDSISHIAIKYFKHNLKTLTKNIKTFKKNFFFT